MRFFCLFVCLLDVAFISSVSGEKAQGELECYIKVAQQWPAKALQTKGIGISKIQLGLDVSPINH